MCQENQRRKGKGIKGPLCSNCQCIGANFSKLGPITKDLCIYYICFKKIAFFMLLLTVNKRNVILGALVPLSGYKRRRLYMSGAYMRDYRVHYMNPLFRLPLESVTYRTKRDTENTMTNELLNIL